MEIHIVTGSNQRLNLEIFEKYLRARHEIYATELKWVPPSPDGLERDKYDTPRAVHFIGVEDGEVIAGSRLCQTTGPHLLADHFPHLCSGGAPLTGPRIAEWTRGFVVKSRRGRGAELRLLFAFCHAIMEYSLDEGIELIGGIQRTYWLTMWHWMNWKVRIHGEAVSIDGHPWVPAYFEVSQTALKGAANCGRIDGSLLVRHGRLRPFIELVLDPVYPDTGPSLVLSGRHLARTTPAAVGRTSTVPRA